MSLLSVYKERESKILASDEVVHSFDRVWPAYLALPLLDLLIARGNNPRVLEVGCGNGYALKTLLEENASIDASNLIGTSLSRLPGHRQLERLGIHVYTAPFQNGCIISAFNLVKSSTFFSVFSRLQ